jgi:DNA-binding MarR family transcriptional regulator
MEFSASPLQREIRQSKPFQSKGEEAVLGLLKTADLVRRLIAQVLEPYEVTPQQYNVLRILRGAGSEGIPTLAIRERMLEQTPGITRLIDRLEAKDWAERRRCSGDRRQVLCFLTPSGDRLLAALDEPMSRLDSEAVGVALSDEQIDQLVTLLDSIRAAHAPPYNSDTESKGDTCNE